ncbi:MAG TPA: hypothetical protein VII75_02410 [Thermoanaerobaculia bacterium]
MNAIWLYPPDGIYFYRPVFSPDGSSVVFEHTPLHTTSSTLYICATSVFGARGDGSAATPFLKDAPAGVQSRPDWSLANGEVAFQIDSALHTCDQSGGSIAAVKNGAGLAYPAWYPKAAALMAIIDGEHALTKLDFSGNRSPITPSGWYAGMGTVNQATPSQIAFAGQINNGLPYDQNDNQIWLYDGSGDPTQFDDQQGRAPWYSPDGTQLVFESNRGGNYQIWLSANGGDPDAITDPAWGAQHAKFSPDGKTIVFAGIPPGLQRMGLGILTVPS